MRVNKIRASRVLSFCEALEREIRDFKFPVYNEEFPVVCTELVFDMPRYDGETSDAERKARDKINNQMFWVKTELEELQRDLPKAIETLKFLKANAVSDGGICSAIDLTKWEE